MKLLTLHADKKGIKSLKKKKKKLTILELRTLSSTPQF